MAELKPVPGQILLTDGELTRLGGVAAHGLRSLGGSDDDRIAAGQRMVRSIMQVLNGIRFGQPAGELRRSPAGSLAVRAQDQRGGLIWDVVHLDPADGKEPRTVSAEKISGWSVIHPESWLARLTDIDYEEANKSE